MARHPLLPAMQENEGEGEYICIEGESWEGWERGKEEKVKEEDERG